MHISTVLAVLLASTSLSDASPMPDPAILERHINVAPVAPSIVKHINVNAEIKFVKVIRRHKGDEPCGGDPEDGVGQSQSQSQRQGQGTGTPTQKSSSGNNGGRGTNKNRDPAAAASAARASFAIAAKKATKPDAAVAPSAFATKGLTGTAAIDALANTMNGQTNPFLLEIEGREQGRKD